MDISHKQWLQIYLYLLVRLRLIFKWLWTIDYSIDNTIMSCLIYKYSQDDRED